MDFRRTNVDSTIFGINSSNGYFTISKSTGQNFSAQITVESGSANGDQLILNYTPTGTLSSTGSGEEFLPPYITVYAWYRTA